METWSAKEDWQRGDIAERRLWPREALSSDIGIEFLRDEFGVEQSRQWTSCRLRDLSESGLRMATDHRLEAGGLLELWLSLPGQTGAIHLLGEVVWCDTRANGDCYVGVDFLNPSHDAMAKLEQVLDPLLH